MPTLDEVYRKFGEVSEAAQILEAQLGNLLLAHKCIDAGLLERPDSKRATEICKAITKQTLGQLRNSLGSIWDSVENPEKLLNAAVASRNRLTHSFYLQHNFRRNSDDGREVMLRDLEVIHEDLWEAYRAVLLLSGIDLEKFVEEVGDISLPIAHVPLLPA